MTSGSRARRAPAGTRPAAGSGSSRTRPARPRRTGAARRRRSARRARDRVPRPPRTSASRSRASRQPDLGAFGADPGGVSLDREPLDPRARGAQVRPAGLEEARSLARAGVELVDRVQPLARRGLGRLGRRRAVARAAEPAMELVLRGGDLARVGALLRTVEVLAQRVVRALGLAQRVGGRLRVDARLGRDRAALVHEPARDVARIGGCGRDRHRPGQLVVGCAAGEAAGGSRDRHGEGRGGEGRRGVARRRPRPHGDAGRGGSDVDRGDGRRARQRTRRRLLRRGGLVQHGDAGRTGPRGRLGAPFRVVGARLVARERHRARADGDRRRALDGNRDRAGGDAGRHRWNGRSTRRRRAPPSRASPRGAGPRGRRGHRPSRHRRAIRGRARGPSSASPPTACARREPRSSSARP